MLKREERKAFVWKEAFRSFADRWQRNSYITAVNIEISTT